MRGRGRCVSPYQSRCLKSVGGYEVVSLGMHFVGLGIGGRSVRGGNPPAARIWELIDGRRTAAEIAHQIAIEFAVSKERVVEDLLSFLSVLLDRQLLVRGLIGPAAIQGQER